MRKMRFNMFAVLMMLLTIVTFTQCKKDDPATPKTSGKPVLNTNFKFEVAANGYTVTFTSLYAAGTTVSWFNVGTGASSTNAVYTTDFNNKGAHKMVFSEMVNGVFVPSDTFIVTTTVDNLTYLTKKIWQNLVGTGTTGKTWRLDMKTAATGAGACVYFAGPLYFSGYGDNTKTDYEPYWAWTHPALPFTTTDGTSLTSYFGWSPDYAGNTWLMTQTDYGTITFKGDLTVSTTRLNPTGGASITENGTFTFDTTAMMIKLSGAMLPIDTSHIRNKACDDWYSLSVFSMKDSSMQLGLKRVYDGPTSTSPKWILIYNFVVDSYTYAVPEIFTYSESVKTSFAKSDLVGTWKYDVVPQGWIAWTKTGDQGTVIPAHMFGKWDTRDQIVTDMKSWGASTADSTFTSNDAKSFVFNDDGTCTLAGVTNTYTVSNGVVTFGTALAGELSGVWISLTGTELKVIDFAKYGDPVLSDYTYSGFYIGQQNGTKNEYMTVHLVKASAKKSAKISRGRK